MIATPLLALILDYHSAVLTAAVPLWALASLWLFTKRRLVLNSGVPWTLLPGVVVGSTIGVVLQTALPPSVSLRLLSALLVFSVVLPWVVKRLTLQTKISSSHAAPVLGCLAGATESALNVGAPFIVLFSGIYRFSRLQMMFALNLCFCLGKSIQLALLFSLGRSKPDWALLVIGTAVSYGLFRVGDNFAGRYPENRFKKALSVFLVGMAVLLVIRSLLIG